MVCSTFEHNTGMNMHPPRVPPGTRLVECSSSSSVLCKKVVVEIPGLLLSSALEDDKELEK